MKKLFMTTAIVALLGNAGGALAVDQAAIDKQHAAANAIASKPGEDLTGPAWLCDYNKHPGGLTAGADPGPAKAFDNLYFVGTGRVGAWVIKTSAGLILMDTLDNPDEAQHYILDGIKKLGLDPTAIKYIVVTHAHADHYGGAKFLQDKIPGVHVLMSAKDWNVLATNPPKPKPGVAAVAVPTHDMVISDGEKLTLGDETITLYLTPGHTVGTVSALIPVKDHGTPHMIAEWGGIPFNAKEDEATFQASLKRFRGVMAANHAEGRISNHPIWDNTLLKIAAVRKNPNGPSPWLETPDDMARYAQIQDICLKAQHIRLNS